MDTTHIETLLQARETAEAPASPRSEQPYLLELIRVLHPHPSGLRRWTIMQAIRRNREKIGLAVPQKLEDQVERAFLHRCADTEAFKKRNSAVETALFHRPQGKAGEVWAVYPERAEAWLKAETGTDG